MIHRQHVQHAPPKPPPPRVPSLLACRFLEEINTLCIEERGLENDVMINGTVISFQEAVFFVFIKRQNYDS